MKVKELLLFCMLCLSQAVVAQADFSADTLSNEVFARMQRKSFPAECTVKRADLRYLSVLHYDAEGNVKRGELVCNKAIAADLLYIFEKLYEARYPIERMQLIDDYDANDEQSMRHNNTSCFCFRAVSGTKVLSKHALGLAVDINPLYNPYVKGNVVQPSTARKWVNRSNQSVYTIKKGDLLWRLFTKRGFQWGGVWKSLKDYQHFEK